MTGTVDSEIENSTEQQRSAILNIFKRHVEVMASSLAHPRNVCKVKYYY